MGWLFRRAPHRRSLEFLDKYARDILVDPYYRALEQHPTAVLWIYIAHAMVFGIFGLLLGRLISGNWAAGRQLAVSLIVWGVFYEPFLFGISRGV